MMEPFSPGDPVAGYFRDSGGDEQDLSIDRQIAEFRRWLNENRLREGAIFTDAARPGSSTVGRHGFQAMIRHFRSGLAEEKGLVVWRSNRFGRNVNDNQFYKADLRRRGVIIHSLTDKIPQDRYGQIIEYLLDWKDQEFLQTLSEDVASGLRLIVETYGAVPGTPPRGFTREPVTIGKRRTGQPHIVHRWVPDETMTPLVRRAFQMLLDGASLANIQIATGLYSSINSWNTFFRNPLYKGVLHYKDLVIDNYCEPVVEPAVWERAQRILDARAGRRHLTDTKDPQLHPRRVASPWLLSGVARCPKCDSPLNGHVIKEWQYYACSRSVRRRDCAAVKIPAPQLEEAVLQAIRNLLADPEALARVQSEHLVRYEQATGEFPARRNEITARLENLRRQISRLIDTIAEHGHSPALLDKLTALETQEYELKDELAQIDLLLQSRPDPVTPERIQRLAARFEETLAAGSPEERRQALAGWISRLLVERDGKKILVQLDVFVPPMPGPDPPGRRARNVVQHIGPPWGHTETAEQAVFVLIRASARLARRGRRSRRSVLH
jgi:DNA invertase Pin-like site-specific DNA recombinase